MSVNIVSIEFRKINFSQSEYRKEQKRKICRNKNCIFQMTSPKVIFSVDSYMYMPQLWNFLPFLRKKHRIINTKSLH